MMRKTHVLPRIRIVFGLVGALLAHVAEVWIFSFGYFFLDQFNNTGKLVGSLSHSYSDYVYFSFSTYTSLGFGDIVPEGPLRFITGMEVLLGLVLIAWTASFMYVQMERFWRDT
ncbi:MAG: potassium channel family protein [Gammaproteobacteria bacterium]|nr:potassium channel family protein [Gammaproteobacteria bacterium]